MEKLNLDSSPEDKAGCGAVCVELAFRIDDLPFSDCSAATGVNYVCLATDQAGFRRHWPDIVDLDFQRRVTRPHGKS